MRRLTKQQRVTQERCVRLRAMAALQSPIDHARAAKAECPEALVLIRVGDFYEAFGADAQTAAAKLGLHITKRGDVAMVGFPYHQLDAYLGKLIACGERVALCEWEQPFALTNDAPKPQPWRPTNEKVRQTMLLSGAFDCLPGQLDLFATDGESNESKQS